MKKILLVISLLLLTGSIVWVAVPQHPLKETAVHMGVGDDSCDQEGYLTPRSMSFVSGDKVRIKFTNDQSNAVTIKGLPGGDIPLKARANVIKEFTADKNFSYNVWVKNQCQVAKGSVDISHASNHKLGYFVVGILAVISAAVAWVNWSDKPSKFSRR
jgi:hypothetical protein